MAKTCIVVLNYNGLEDTRRCLQSLRVVSNDEVAIVVVDNASAEDPCERLRAEFPWCTVVRNHENGGWAGGNNVGIRWALEHGADHALLLNNDTVVAPDLCQALRAAAAANPSFGIIGPVINFIDEPDVVMTDGCRFNRPSEPGFFPRVPVPLSAASSYQLTEVDVVNGCCMMVAAAVFSRIGLMDERFFLVHEESDFCLRARQAGFQCGVLGRTLVWHKGSTSFKRNDSRLQRYYDARNLYLLLRKHQRKHHGGRGAWRSRLEYLKYVYYRYAMAREENHSEVAEGVLQGVYDALRGRYGPYRPSRRWGLVTVKTIFKAFYRLRHGPTANAPAAVRAAAHR